MSSTQFHLGLGGIGPYSYGSSQLFKDIYDQYILISKQNPQKIKNIKLELELKNPASQINYFEIMLSEYLFLDFDLCKTIQKLDILHPPCFEYKTDIGKEISDLLCSLEIVFIVLDREFFNKNSIGLDLQATQSDMIYEVVDMLKHNHLIIDN